VEVGAGAAVESGTGTEGGGGRGGTDGDICDSSIRCFFVAGC
jgi:hypothetical protein